MSGTAQDLMCGAPNEVTELTQLVSFASQNKEDKSSPRREGLGFCFAKQGGLYGKRN